MVAKEHEAILITINTHLTFNGGVKTFRAEDELAFIPWAGLVVVVQLSGLVISGSLTLGQTKFAFNSASKVKCAQALRAVCRCVPWSGMPF